MTDYTRVIISGSLHALSALHIGSGEEAAIDPDLEETCNAVLIDASSKPYLPASTLRGYLRSRITDETQRKTIFGYARQRRGEIESGQIGQLRTYDAPLTGAALVPNHLSRTSVDPLTAAAKEHQLSTHEVVAPGAVFSAHLEMDDTDESMIESVLKALASFNDAPDARLGKGKSIGQGKLEWTLEKVKVLTAENFIAWLNSPFVGTVAPNVKTESEEVTKTQMDALSLKPDAGFWDFWLDETPKFRDRNISSQSRWKSLELRLIASSPILINDPHLVKQRRDSTQKEKPDAVFMQRDNLAVIPASTLKGWARGQCRRILLTLNQNRSYEAADRLLSGLFGSTDEGQGCLRFEDAVGDLDTGKLHCQTFNAVDRFTGGVKNSALYNAEAAWPSGFTTRIHYDPDNIKDWMRLLIRYVQRDAMEGDLVLGWGKSKGYGRLRLLPIEMENFDLATLEAWHQQLIVALKNAEKT